MVRQAGTAIATLEYIVELEVNPAPDQRADYEIQRAVNVGAPGLKIKTIATISGDRPRFIDRHRNDTEVFWYRARAVKEGWSPSGYCSWVATSAVAVGATDEPATVVATIIAGTPILSGDTGADRQLVTAPQIASDSAGNPDLEDGDSIVYSFDAPPNWWPAQTGLVWETTLVDGDTTTHIVRLENVTSSSADVVAELQQPGSATNRDDNFGGVASAITTVGGTTDSDNLTIAQLPAHNNLFTVRGNVEFTNSADPLKVPAWRFGWADIGLKVYSYDAGLAAYTLRDTLTVESLVMEPGTGHTVAWAAAVSAPDVDGDSGDRFRIEVSEFNGHGGAATDMIFSCWGEDTAGYATNGVAWQTLTATTVSATDATLGATVRFLLMDADNIV